MKIYLYDWTNFGVLYVYDYPNKSAEKIKWFFNILRSCVLDTGISRIVDTEPLYKIFTNQAIVDNLYVINFSAGTRLGEPSELNTVFINKRNQAQLIAPVVEKLVEALYNRVIFSWPNEIGINIHDTLALEVMNSSPDTGHYTSGILEYAHALNISPEQAYTEIKLESDTLNSLKMRAYAVSKKYQVLIRQVKTQAQADALGNEITQKLVADSRI